MLMGQDRNWSQVDTVRSRGDGSGLQVEPDAHIRRIGTVRVIAHVKVIGFPPVLESIVMNVIQCGASFGRGDLRHRIFQGDIVIAEPTAASLKLAAFARDLLWEAFTPLNPLDAHRSVTANESVDILRAAKRRIASDPTVTNLVRDVVADMKCDISDTYFDGPIARTMTNTEHLSVGPARPLRPHRDLWYAAPLMQINWWMPIFAMSAENGIAFYPEYWARRVENSSSQFRADDTGDSVCEGTNFMSGDDLPCPEPEEVIDAGAAFKPVLQPGALVLFSAAHLHATVPNATSQTRFSLDFRTVDINDVASGTGANNPDSVATGTTLHRFRGVADLAPFPVHAVPGPHASQPQPTGLTG